MTKIDLTTLSEFDIHALGRSLFLELENRTAARGVTKYVEREIPSTVNILKLSDLKKGDKVKFVGPKNEHQSTKITVGKIYEIDEIDLNGDVMVIGDNNNPNSRPYFSKNKLHLLEKVVEAETVEPVKSPNQQRAELIQRAREFVKSRGMSDGRFYHSEKSLLLNGEFIVNKEKRTVVCLLRGTQTRTVFSRGIAKCMPSDVFNADIGKAIALARALQIDIPQEFTVAVQPQKVVVGMMIQLSSGDSLLLTQPNPDPLRRGEKIIDDTYAEYGEGE